LRGFLAERLAGHEIPSRVLLLPALPRNPGGKVVKTRLRELAADPDAPLLRATPRDAEAAPRPDALAEPAPAGRGEPASPRDSARTGATR